MNRRFSHDFELVGLPERECESRESLTLGGPGAAAGRSAAVHTVVTCGCHPAAKWVYDTKQRFCCLRKNALALWPSGGLRSGATASGTWNELFSVASK